MCILISVGLALTLYSDEPKSIAIEDCNNKIKVTYMENPINELKIIKFDEESRFYIVEAKE